MSKFKQACEDLSIQVIWEKLHLIPSRNGCGHFIGRLFPMEAEKNVGKKCANFHWICYK